MSGIIASVIIGACIVFYAGFIVVRLVRKIKAGKNTCGCGCENCSKVGKEFCGGNK